MFTNRERQVINAYKKLINEKKETNIENISQSVFGSNDIKCMRNTQTIIWKLRNKKVQPFVEKFPAARKVKGNNKDNEFVALEKMIKILNNLKPAMLKKVIELIKDNPNLLTQLAEALNGLENDCKKRILNYIKARYYQ